MLIHVYQRPANDDKMWRRAQFSPELHEDDDQTARVAEFWRGLPKSDFEAVPGWAFEIGDTRHVAHEVRNVVGGVEDNVP